MAYESLPGVTATFPDGNFKEVIVSSQPRILLLGTASSGRSNEIYNVTSVAEAEREFGPASSVIKAMHEAIRTGADNIGLMRIGGRPGSVLVEDGGSLFISPALRDAESLDRYRFMQEENPSGYNRFAIYDTIAEEFVYDTLEELCTNGEAIELEEDGFGIYSVGDINDPTEAPLLSALTTGALGTFADAAVTDITFVTGDDGEAMSLPEKYAALESAYSLLDFADADFIVPKGVYIDAPNQADDGVPDYSAGVPVPGTAGDALGVVWHLVFRNKVYTYMAESTSVITSGIATRTFGTSSPGRLTISADDPGVAGEEYRIRFTDTVTAGSETATISGTDITIAIEDGVTTVAQILTAISGSAPVAAVIDATATAAGALTVTAVLGTYLRLAVPGILHHDELTGDEVPAAVEERFRESVATEWREVNFAHQLASFCHRASASWKPIFGFISFSKPSAFSKAAIAQWAGQKPTYTRKGTQLVIDTVADNGFGVLGNKFMAGAHNYRNGSVEAGDNNDGLAYGGFILTKGSQLPNGSDFPYGILDTDEALDKGGKPVDIGKHISVTSGWVVLSNSFNGGSRYRGSTEVVLASKYCQLPANEEAYGSNGIIPSASDAPRFLAATDNDIASLRICNVRREANGIYFIKTATAAHPDSDYTRIAIMRSISRALTGIREIGKRFIAKDFTQQKVIAMHSSMDSFLLREKQDRFNQGFKVNFEFTRRDIIAGRCKVKLRIIPPFILDAIDVEVSLAAEESEL